MTTRNPDDRGAASARRPDHASPETEPGGPGESQRQYLRITPTDTSVSARSVQAQFRRLHEFAWQVSEPTGWASRLTSPLGGTTETPQTIEWLLVTDGNPDEPLRYYLGVETAAESTADETQTASTNDRTATAEYEALGRIARSMFPNDYQIDRVRWHPRDLLTAIQREIDTEAESIRTDAETTAGVDDPDSGQTTGDDRASDVTPVCEAVDFIGRATRRDDWQTRLIPLDAWLDGEKRARPPLSELVETLASSHVPMAYQVLMRPKASWGAEAADRRYALLEGIDTPISRWARDFGLGSDDYGERNREALERRHADDDDPFGESGSPKNGSPVHRVQSIDVRDADHSFVVTARLVARGPPEMMGDRCQRLTDIFTAASGPYHRIIGRHRTSNDAVEVRDALCDRIVNPPAYERATTRLPGVPNTSRGIVADPREAPSFCVIDGGSLTPAAMEGLAPTPGERARPRGPPPARDRLTRYRGPGLTLGQFQPGWTTGSSETGVGYHAGVRERTEERESRAGTDETFLVRLPPALQRLHIAWFGKTGSGKTTAATVGLLDNHAATDGATVVIDQKGDGMAEELSRMRYAEAGSLDEVIYFDCTRTLPAISFFDIRDQLAAGVSRDVAVADVAAHYAEILAQLHADYHAAGVSVKVIEAVVKALFDPVHGDDAFTHREFRSTLSWMAEHQSAPAVSNPQLERVLTDAVTGPQREFANIMTGVTNRVDEITLQTQLDTMLNHVWSAQSAAATRAPSPDAAAREQSEPVFDFVDLLDENVIVVFDMGGLREEAQRALTLLILSTLWTALRRRVHRRRQLYGQREDDGRMGDAANTRSHRGATAVSSGNGGGDTASGSDAPDRKGVTDTTSPDGVTDATTAEGVTDVHENGIAEGKRARSEAGVQTESGDADGHTGWDDGSATASTAAPDHEAGPAALSLVNLHVEEASRVAVSGVFSDLLAQARSFGCSVTLSMQYPAQLKHADPEAYSEVLNNVSTVVTGNVPLDRDLAARLATEDMEPQEVANRLRALSRGEWLCALPAGFGEVEPRPFVIESAPLPPGHPEGPRPLSPDQELHFEIAQARRETRTRRQYGLSINHPNMVPQNAEAEAGRADGQAEGGDGDGRADTDIETVGGDDGRRQRVDTTLPYTLRLPKTVSYTDAVHGLVCTECESRYDPTTAGIERAIVCCSSPDSVDPDDVPVTDVNLKLSRSERAETGLSDAQLMLLQVIYNAQQLRYEAPAYDILFDSMIRLIEYVGADKDDVQALIDAEYLTHDTDHPHRLYSVTPAGRDCLGEAYREGVDYGHGLGDLEETSAHVLMVEAARRYLIQTYVEDPESPVTRVVPYYEIGDHRLDLAGLDDEGNVVIAVEAERVNHDLKRAAPSDFDKMAACEPAEAIWVVLTTPAAHDVIDALHDPLDGEPRLESSYSRTTMPDEFALDEPGLTDVFPVKQFLTELERP
jgi:hypothetical protein